MVLQNAASVCAVDFDPIFVKDVNERMDPKWNFECKVHDIMTGPVAGTFDAAFSLDVIEHIAQSDEHVFLGNIVKSLDQDGALIIGTPSIQSQAYAHPASKEGHINCKDEPGLRQLMECYFRNVFMFSMNDEIVHTGFHPMAHYLFALCVGPKENK
jgi:2-polyprenyl-3-methyl-5-hydroxy-6-metoxy-1,4-benzoquinol methylase